MNDWKTRFVFWDPGYFQGRTVSFRECKSKANKSYSRGLMLMMMMLMMVMMMMMLLMMMMMMMLMMVVVVIMLMCFIYIYILILGWCPSRDAILTTNINITSLGQQGCIIHWHPTRGIMHSCTTWKNQKKNRWVSAKIGKTRSAAKKNCWKSHWLASTL